MGKVMTVAEVCAALGCSRWTVRRLEARGMLRRVPLAGMVRYYVEGFLAERNEAPPPLGEGASG